MEHAGFGKQSGPTASTGPKPSSQIFGNVAPPPSNPSSSLLRSPRPFVQSPPSWSDGQRSFEYIGAQSQRPRPSSSSSSSSPTVTSIVASRNSENSVSLRVSRSQPDTSGNFSQAVPSSNNFAGEGLRPSPVRAVPIRQYVPPRAHSPELAYKNTHSVEGYRPSPVGAGPVRHFAPPRTYSPELAPKSNQFLDGFRPLGGVRPSVEAGPASSGVPPRTRSPEAGFKISNPVLGFRPSGGASPVRPAPNSLDGQPKSRSNYVNLQATQDRSSVSPNTSVFDHQRSLFDGVQSIDRRRSVTPPNDEYSPFPQNNLKRPMLAHSPALGATPDVNFGTHDSQAPRKSLRRVSNALPEAVATNPTSFPVAKRSRSPPPLSSNQATKGDPNVVPDDEREMLAKAKRLARFKVELGKREESSGDTAQLRASAKLQEPPAGRRGKFPENSAELTEDFPSGIASSEHEGSGPSSVIIGLCTDMCPESERAERERKGDLDRFERLDGDRNQTSKTLAVKKYNRTAEREANLIRPMPVLQKTIKYLLNLLDKPYSDKFLATYNFLWDRMRAIRMDLRMQHLFNQGAIVMLEQMIRLHIIAMHELCEYSKGEGFSEGFDAHLNIEQMNKASVELFQMYDDHRKKGIVIPTEKEFRGYYALLKLDKHPGYIVEPAELSLDLAKMTPEIRQTKEVLFAREVARACRTGNFIAFFRLARKASYLQACLMHAHFAKLRTQALASLHAGLQNNQGLPIIHVAEWLAMEEEDMESLLEYHGFVIKVFDEPYMVKDGQFVNGDKDYDTRRSILVDTKKSGVIFEDVVPSTEVISPEKTYQNNYKPPVKKLISKAAKEIQSAKKNENELKVFPSVERKRAVQDISSIRPSSPIQAVDEDIADLEVIPSPKGHKIMQPITETSAFSQQHEREQQSAGFNAFSWGSFPDTVANPWTPSLDTSFTNSSQRSIFSGGEEIPLQAVPETTVQDSLLDAPSSLVSEDPMPQELLSELEEEPVVFLEENENEDIVADNQHKEIAEAKLKLILRLWKRHASRKRELREKRQLAANAALNSLPLGFPVQLKRDPPGVSGEFDIDRALRERHQKHEQSWSRLNVSEEIAAPLSRRNPDAKCLCWKMIICSQVNESDEVGTGQGNQSADLAVGSWLSSKLMPAHSDDDDNELIVSSPKLSIWKKWVPGKLCTDLTYCLSVVKDVSFNDPTGALTGASAVMFLVCDSIPWNLQKARLQKVLMSIPSGSSLPLLIVSGSNSDKALDRSSIIVNELGLADLDKSRVSSFLVISLIENHQTEFSDGFFSDARLREGLQWLASESPPQLSLHRTSTHDLIIAHLSPFLEVLDRTRDNEVNPNDCVWAINEAVDRSLAEVNATAKANRTSWPCPEISLVEELATEHLYAEERMPENGWSSAEKIEPLMSAMHDCKLPLFQEDLSYLTNGSKSGAEIETQRVEFAKSLVRYLTESTKLMGLSLAIKEAAIMLQSSRLELQGPRFHIVPNWVTIFRRIFNWRLTGIATSASAYILQRPEAAPAPGGPDESGLKGIVGLPSYHLNQPSLDEMIQASCRPSSFGNNPPLLPEANQVVARVECNDVAQEEVETGDLIMEDDFGVGQDGSRVAAGQTKEEADRLSKLLEKCNILQNMIDEKLSVYF